MSHIISFIILWLILAYFFDSFVTAAVVIFVFAVLFLILRIKIDTNKTRKMKPFDEDSVITNTSSSTYISHPQMKNNISTKSNTQFLTYEVYHRNKDKFCDNMNYRIYQCKGLYAQTKRKRSKKIEAFSESDAVEQLKQAGFIEPFEIERIAFPPVTDAQKNALGNIYLGDVCKYDASSILSKQYDNDSTPNPQLISFAEECKIKFSYYIGKKHQYDLIFNSLELRDKIAFFIFCVYRYTTDDRQANLNNSLYRDLFYKFSDDNLSNEKFIKSMNSYEGNSLRFFGTLTVNNVQLFGGSTKTIAYKTAIDFLKQHFSLRNIATKSL